MAFFSGLSSSIGRRLLLYGLRHIDILDKDPADFKLVALLNISVPPEIHLSKARASLLRVTFVLDFGVPQISIEVHGIQVQARLVEDVQEHHHATPFHSPPSSRPTSTLRSRDDYGDNDYDDDEHVPTVDELAKSFIRTEPLEKIQELQQELASQSAYMQDSVASSDDEDEGVAGTGAPLALPAYFRNILNTALDRLSITVNDIDIEVEDQAPKDIDSSTAAQSSPVSLNFHVERIAIDSITSKDVRVEVGSTSSPDTTKLVSDVENLVSSSRHSQPPSPATTRSEASISQNAPSEPARSQISDQPMPSSQSIHSSQSMRYSQSMSEEEVCPEEQPVDDEKLSTSITSSRQASHMASPREEIPSPPRPASPERLQLDSSVHTVDDDRFADANSDDGLDDQPMDDSYTQSHHPLPVRDLSVSSILYDGEGLLDYAMQNGMLNSRFDDAPAMEGSAEAANHWDLDGVSSSQHTRRSEPASDTSMSNLPTVSALGRSFNPPDSYSSPAESRHSEEAQSSTDNLAAAHEHTNLEIQSPTQSTHQLSDSTPSPGEDLAESRFFTHDEAESMYMSAVSARQANSGQHVPGGWDSSSASSKDSASEKSEPMPKESIPRMILAEVPEVDEGCETPRPRSRQSTASPSPPERTQTPVPPTAAIQRQAKRFLTIDEITVWFPMSLGDGQVGEPEDGDINDTPGMDFKPSNLGEDSIFAEMPGSFSNYAYASSPRHKPSLEASTRARSMPKPQLSPNPSEQPKRTRTPSISIDVGEVSGHMDVTTGRIMFGMFGRAMQALTGEASSQEDVAKTTKEGGDEISKGAESIREGELSNWLLELNPSGAILKVTLSRVHVNRKSRTQASKSQIHIGKFVLASLDQDLISFQSSRPKSRRSVNDLRDPLKHDIEIDYDQGTDDRITVVTRPVKVMIDIQKLDDALGSFGGFSGMLELSNSMSSASTVQSAVIAPAHSKPRGVHFGDGLPPPVKAPAPSAPAPKIQVQFGEVSFTLKGKTCSVQLQTTTVRIAVRQSNVRLKISEIQLMGPYTSMSQKSVPLIVELRGTTLNFLFAPEETDLARLISMITPSKDPYENDDDILIDTLLRQRRKGSVLRVEVSEVGVRILDLQQMKTFEALGAELARLSKVAKYLPDDDRPGLLSLAAVKKLDVRVAINEKLGDISVVLQDAAVAHVGVPALLATEVGKVFVCRDDEVLVHEVVKLRASEQLPAIMLRMVGDEMEPVAKAKLFNVCVEYRVTTIMAALGISEDATVEEITSGLASSVATITGASSPQTLSQQSSEVSSPSPSAPVKPLQIDVLLRKCAIGLNPRKSVSKGLFVLTEAHIACKQAKSDYTVTVELRKASMHAIDDTARLDDEHEPVPPSITTNRHLHELSKSGYVSLSTISAAKVFVNISGDGKDQPQLVDVEFKNELFVIESCADSTQTLMAILNGLQPPSPPATGDQYRTVVPLQEMMESFTGDALAQDDYEEPDDFMSNADLIEDDLPTNLEFVGSIYNSQSLPTDEEMGDSLLGEDDLGALASPPAVRQRGDPALLESFQEKFEITKGEEEFDFSGDYFKDSDEEAKGKARKWDSTKNQYHLPNEFKAPDAPIKVRVRDVNVIWNLYDGYDWPRTRSVISQAVDDVEARAEERRRKARDEEDDDDWVEEDFLFNSVWIGVPIKDEKGALARRINHDIDDLASETGSYATTTATRSTGATSRPRGTTRSKRRLKLERSKHKKIAFSLMGVAVDLIVFPPDSGETINSINVRVQDLEVFDHVPTSTWKKFVTCAVNPLDRELIRPMINLEIVTVKPVTDLAASELVIKVTILPLRLHVDQDALDFITRFFEFKDDSVPASPPPTDQPFIQRLEVMAVSMKLDYKPKRVDYRGLRSGHTTEFMNFLILDGSDIVLRHAIVYGLTSFDTLHKTLNDVWTPDVRSNQLPGVLSGLAAVRPLVNVGSGIKDLVVVPMREYKKDGRIVRSLQKGVYAFAKNTTSEVARLGAKVAIGTQTLLEGAEVFLNPQTAPNRRLSQDWDGEDPSSDNEEPRAVSNYANQPIGVRAGLRSAARHLERDLLTARDAVIAIPAEVMEEGSGTGVARALARHAPTVILRPALGATKALSNALLGVGNALDEGSRRKIEDKYKSY
ncbi:autophagy regulatory protein Atg2 [Pyrenophora teres f. maculata]|nr:autophagy regulatory protein Atg2 [Pyrenophora teres f. maculata]